MHNIHRFTVVPKLPERLGPLLDIGRNLWWTWTPEARALFQRISPEIWESEHHNPIKLLGQVGAARLDELAEDSIFLAHMDRVERGLNHYMKLATWYERQHREKLGTSIAYFSAEFGLHESLPLYSGGLGILAGDHLKSSSDLGLPLVAVGLCYRVGYFHQYLNRDGWQQETYVENDFYNMPMTLARGEDGEPITIATEIDGRPVSARAWRIQVGRVPLYLLDANVRENPPEDRDITNQLYGGDNDMRLRQEILLGVGGAVLLRKLGIHPTVFHMNEGHSAFLALERIADLMEGHGLSWNEAKEAVHASTTFTTHTPVPAGNDIFQSDLIERYFGSYCGRVGITIDDLMALGRQDPAESSEGFSMTVLALRTAGRANGVSELHGKVSRKMWQGIWPNVPQHELPIIHITNGIHTQSWYSREIADLYDRYLGPRWHEDPVDHRVWERVDRIPDSELWRAQFRMREGLVGFARRRLRQQLERRGSFHSDKVLAGEILDPEVLTVGFARRFATYKRATLLFKDLERLAGIVNHPKRPVQFIFAGKAHPRDHLGKELIRDIMRIANREEFRRRVVFLEDYDIEVGRMLVQGVDVWLNTPRRPLEASGTSGMKAPVNGGVNVSVLDGWWCEGYAGDNGWVIGSGEEYEDLEYQDIVESMAIYDIFESEVAPTFYRRGADGVPREWIAIAKASMRRVAPVFSTNRMVEDYALKMYFPASAQWGALTSDNMHSLRELARWKEHVSREWHHVKVTEVKADGVSAELELGERLAVTVRVALGPIDPADLTVEAVAGPLNGAGKIARGEALELAFSQRSPDNGEGIFQGEIRCAHAGRNGLAVRVIPAAQRTASNRFETKLVHWWGEPVEEGTATVEGG